jgi:CheY-like chemotaxis protein
MYILVVEDDHLQYESISDDLKHAFRRVRIQSIRTEYEFRAFFATEGLELPGLVVLDMMLRWADPSENMPEPLQDVIVGGYYRAGLRCEKFLASREQTSNIPVIIYTVLERDDLKEDLLGLRSNVRYLRKESDSAALITLIRELTRE